MLPKDTWCLLLRLSELKVHCLNCHYSFLQMQLCAWRARAGAASTPKESLLLVAQGEMQGGQHSSQPGQPTASIYMWAELPVCRRGSAPVC